MNPGRHSHSRSLAITVSHSRRTDPPTKPARPQTQAFTNDRKSRAHDTRQGQQIESSSALTASFHAGSKSYSFSLMYIIVPINFLSLQRNGVEIRTRNFRIRNFSAYVIEEK